TVVIKMPLSKLVSLISQDPDLTSIFYYAPAEDKCHLEEILSTGTRNLPLLVWRSESNLILNRFVGGGLLVLACLSEMHWQDQLSGLSRSLRYLRQSRIIIEIMEDNDEHLAKAVLQFCQKQYMINANVIFKDFVETKTIFTFDSYPEFKLVTHSFEEDSQLSFLYPDKMLDLRGGVIRTLPDYSEPNTILYHDHRGQRRILGYVWNIIEEYARMFNGSLEVINKYADGRTLNLIEVMDMAKRGLVDIPASLQAMSMVFLKRYHEFSYPVDLASWCTMLPVERDLIVSEMLSRVYSVPGFLFLLILWLVFELVKGRWRRHRRLQTFGWLILFTLVTANYMGKLVTFLAVPPSVHPIASLESLIDTEVRIFTLQGEYYTIDFTQRTKYSGAFRLTSKAEDLIRKRNSLNTSFAYTATTTKWRLYKEQQRRSSRPLFRYSKDICFFETVPVGFPIPENSPHRKPLHRYILQLWQSGLLDFWISRGFSNMVKAGRMHIEDLRPSHQAHTLTFKDMRNVFLMYLVGLLISVTLFVAELIVSWVRFWLGY
ncbi:hypothetical protein KR009_003310, partial [Drosophila setifemur]